MAKFLTVPDELVETAQAASDYFAATGYRVRVEHREAGYPFVPALVVSRRPTTVIVEVSSDIDKARLKTWCQFARSCASDTQVCLVTTGDSPAAAKAQELRELKVGMLTLGPNRLLQEILPRHDLAMQMELPELANAKPAVRRALGPAYEQIDRGMWREAFETACLALETQSRAYLWTALERKRLQLIKKSGVPIKIKKSDVMNGTLGKLAWLIERAYPHNHVDALLATTLPRINKNRVDVAHYKYRREQALRRNVGKHMWAIFQCLGEMQ